MAVKRKTIFGKILGAVTNAGAGVVGSTLGIGGSLQNLGIGAKKNGGTVSSPSPIGNTGGGVVSVPGFTGPLDLNKFVTLPSVTVEAEKSNMMAVGGAILGGILLLKYLK